MPERQTHPMDGARVAGEPAEAVLDGAAGDLEDAGGLAEPDAGDHQAQEWGVEVRLLVETVGPE